VGKGALAPCHHLSLIVGRNGGHAEPVIGRAFAATRWLSPPYNRRSPEQLIQRRMIPRMHQLGMQSAERFHLHPGIDLEDLPGASGPTTSIPNGCRSRRGLDRELDAGIAAPAPELRDCAADFEIMPPVQTPGASPGGPGGIASRRPRKSPAMICQHANCRSAGSRERQLAANVCLADDDGRFLL